MIFHTTETEIEAAKKFAKHLESRINRGEQSPLVETVRVDDWNAWHQFSLICEIDENRQLSMRKISSRIRAAFRDARKGCTENMPDVEILMENVACPDRIYEYGPFWPEQKKSFKRWSRRYVAIDAVITDN